MLAEGTLAEGYRKGKRYPAQISFTFDDGSQVEYVYNFSKTADGKMTGSDA